MIWIGFWFRVDGWFGIGEVGELREVAFLEFSGLVIVEKQVVEALDLSIVLQRHYLLIQLIQEQPTVLYDSPVIGGLEGKERVELLYQYRNEHVPHIYMTSSLLNFSSRCRSFSPEPSMV